MGFDPGSADSKSEALTARPPQLRDKKCFFGGFYKNISFI